MRTDISTDLQDHLNTRETTLCWCWRIERKDGVVLGFTNHDRPLTFLDTTFEASTGFLGTEIEAQMGMSTDNMEVYGAVDSVNISETDIETGRFDNAQIAIYLVNWRDVSQRVIMKKGNLGEIKRGKVMFQTEVRGLSSQLQQVKGRIYEYACDALLGDSRCGISLSGSTYTGTGTVVTTNGYSTMTVSGLGGYANTWFSKGLITITSGNNDDVQREVKSHFNTDGVVSISLWEPLPYELEAGDTFSIRAGCDKSFKMCKARFNNATRFRGFPHIPGSDTVIQYANTGDPNFDGGGNFLGKD